MVGAETRREISTDEIHAYLQERSPPEATIKQIAMDLGVPPDRVRGTVERMGEWGVVEVDGDAVSLAEGGTDLEYPDDASDMPCPLGCGYRPTSGFDAARHLCGHLFGTYTPGSEQANRAAK